MATTPVWIQSRSSDEVYHVEGGNEQVVERMVDIHFAGEHTSTEFQGFMEGAVETGERAGKEVFQDL